jgi:3-oxoacyl-[acyl-carrier protein] reductase
VSPEGPPARGAVVTGGASGIGAASVARLAADGFAVTSLDLAEPRERADGVTYLQVDITDTEGVTAAVTAAERAEPTHVVVNAAGIRGGRETEVAIDRSAQRLSMDVADAATTSIRAYELIDDAAFRAMFEVHLLGSFAVIRSALGPMLDRRAGSVVNISSICGLVGCDVTPHYSAMKAALIGMSRSLARDASRSNVRVNVVAPGFVTTPMMRQMSDARSSDLLAQIPMGRFAEAAEIADVVAFLAGPGSTYVTGQVVSPNGGMVMQ